MAESDLGSYELLLASVYSAPFASPNALVPCGAPTPPVMFGRPNISGYVTNIKARGRWNGSMESTSSGALEAALGTSSTGDTGGSADLRLRINLDASNSSSIYKSIAVVQPASLRYLACIKI